MKKQKILNEAQLKKIISESIKKILKEEIGSPFASVEEKINDKTIAIEEKIKQLQYLLQLLNNYAEVVNGLDMEIKQRFHGIIGPQEGEYDTFIYKFPEPIHYDMDNDRYGNIDGSIEETIKDMIPREFQRYISVYEIFENNSYDIISGFKVQLDIDDIYSDYD